MLTAGDIINQRYQLQTKLGRNAGRQTWLARDLQSEKQSLVVVKLLAFGGDVQWQDLKLFEREAQILQQIDCDRIPKYRDYFSLDERNLWFGLVQEYIPGNSLRELLDKGKRFSEVEVKKIAREIIEILLYLHDSQPPLLHRDIKPSNLILGEDNNIYLVDFGAVQDRAATEGATFTVVGTYGYAPMEQFGGKAVAASDLYALGATLIHLLTRTAPADLPTENLVLQFRDRVSIRPRFADWLANMIYPAVEKRFKTARQALQALNDLEIEKSVSLTKSKFKHDYLWKSKRIKVSHEPNYLDITIEKRGINSVKDGIYLIEIAFWFLVIVLFSKANFVIGLVVFVVSLFAWYPYLDYLFSSTKVIFNPQSFSIVKQKFLDRTRQQGKTVNIQDISINHQIREQESAISKQNADTIVITAKKYQYKRGYQQYSFGNGLTEEEAIWLANEIRNWLNQQ